MSWNKTTAVNHAKSHAGSHSQGRCAEYTRKAIQAGGITLGHTYHAKDYGPMLRSAGFSPIGTFEQPRAGDVSSFSLMREETQAGIWRYLTVRRGTPILDNVICGPDLAIGRQNRHLLFTGNHNEIALAGCSGFVTLRLLCGAPRQLPGCKTILSRMDVRLHTRAGYIRTHATLCGERRYQSSGSD